MANPQVASQTPAAGGFTDEVLSHLLTAITDEMSWIVLRSAYTTFVKETQDFAAALVSTDGEVIAYPRNTGVTSMIGMQMQAGVKAFDWKPGDIMIANDPYLTRGMVMHLNDIYVFKPVFVDGELICFAWTFIHFTDVGGAAPGSVDMFNTEIHQEGLRLRPVLLYKEGVFNEELWNIITDNSRIPSLNKGDMDALISAVHKADQRLQGLAERYGVASLRSAMTKTVERSEQITRAVLAGIPKGRYSFTEYFEEDYVTGIPVKMQVALDVRGDGTVEVDFTGTDPQVRSAINLPSCGQKHHPFLTRAILNYVVTKSPDMHLNGGVIRCVDLKLPEGSLVNPIYPAAIGMRAVTSVRSHDAVLGALMQAKPDVVPAGGASQVAITYVSMSGSGEGGGVVVANPVLGGSGGSATADGISGVDRPLAFLRNVPAEVLESESPVIVHRFGLVPDSEGAGQFRGGFGIRFELELLHPEAVLVTRGKDRHRFAPWGAKGGMAGQPGDAWEMTASAERKYVGKTTVYHPEFGSVMGIQGPGGGGYGDPAKREPSRVLRDVKDGLVSTERARDIYRVAITNSAVDDTETARLRGSAAARPSTFDFGAARSAWEAKFGEAAEAIREWLWTLPPALRHYARKRAFNALAGAGEGPFGRKDVAPIIKDIMTVVRKQIAASVH
jgi:N-methylhydantoinase B